MKTPVERFQQLLRELFQFDCADLDFGIYRIMNHKRDAIERFILETFPKTVIKELDLNYNQKTQSAMALKNLVQDVRKNFGFEAIDSNGELDEKYLNTPLGKKYIEAKKQADDIGDRVTIEADVYNHLYEFFNHYYQEGDFISKRSYSKHHRYAIPYNGEEVYLHWANSDQYYIKTAEHFRDYDWKMPNGVTVRFEIVKVNVEQDNIKGDRRFFIPSINNLQWDEINRKIIIPFEYRPLAKQEYEAYGKKRKPQKEIILDTVNNISDGQTKLPVEQTTMLLHERHRDKKESISYLEHHLRQYTERNSYDFFIHKDLKAFLSRELDFYLKNKVLNLDEMKRAGELNSSGWFQKMRLIKSVGDHIIDFLAQIENFQKLLWEKRKFVTETRYYLAIGSIDPKFYPTIANNKKQLSEWHQLFGIRVDENDPDARINLLQTHPTLVVDTKHYTQEFVDDLLGSFSNLDEMTDGLLVHSENWQALNLLLESHRHQINCVHIDPPYNTHTSGFLYKNGYQHSSWLAMMLERVLACNMLLNPDGNMMCHINDDEYEKLHLALDQISFPDVGTIIWDKRNPMTGGGGIATQHEYIEFRSSSPAAVNFDDVKRRALLEKAKELISRDGRVTKKVRKEFRNWVLQNKAFGDGEKAYQFIDDDGQVYQSVSLRSPEPRADPKHHEPLIHPKTGQPCQVPPNGFSRTPENLKSMIKRGEILFGSDHTTQPRQKLVLNTRRQLTSVVQNATKGKPDLDALGLDNFPYCHSASFYTDLLKAASNQPDDMILDYFAGSGTTGHAVMNLNREDGGQRKFILVELGKYFDTILVPRIKKIIYAPTWKKGKPTYDTTAEGIKLGPRIVKCIQLESYEDALNNIEFETEQKTLEDQFDDYLLKYMLKWETKKSETLLKVDNLTAPFSYKLRLHVDGQTQTKTVDIPETFRYLLGLNVSSRRSYHNHDRRYLVYRGETNKTPGRTVVVIWRKTDGWQKKDFESDRIFVEERGLADDASTIYVNGDSLIPSAKPVEKIFKDRMFAGVGT